MGAVRLAACYVALCAEGSRKQSCDQEAEIDKQLRVIEFGQYTANMQQVLQAAHSELNALELKKSTGKIPLHVLTRQDLVEHAKATSAHMAQIGLGQDRLNVDLIRLFNGFVTVPPPVQAVVEAPAERTNAER